jgi:hypothetical protein
LIPIYFAHGYREREAPFAEYFTKLMGKLDLVPSLDPPSEDVNSAKLEHHLRHTEGLVAVLTNRPTGPSQHILYEISMAARARKPILVFIEDTLPTDILPNGLFQSRFSTKSYFREWRDHLHNLEIFKKYLGDIQLPKYKISSKQRSCMLIGSNILSKNMKRRIESMLKLRGYKSNDIDSKPIPFDGFSHFDISTTEVAIAFLDSKTISTIYALATVQAVIVPTIILSYKEIPLKANTPKEYQRRILNHDEAESMAIIEKQIELFEEDFLSIDSSEKASAYASKLDQLSYEKGKYTNDQRKEITSYVNNFSGGFSVGDTFNVQSGSIVGKGISVSDSVFTNSHFDYSQLTKELGILFQEIKNEAEDPQHFIEVAAIAEAEEAAKKNDGPGLKRALMKTGKWTLGTAEKIGVSLLSGVLKTTLGL